MERNLDLRTSGKIGGMSVSKQVPSISHIFFIDSTLIFGRATKEKASYLKFAICLYERASGQYINLDKSCIFLSPNTALAIIHDILHTFGIPQVDGHGKYLGLPSIVGKNKKEIFCSLKDEVRNKLQGWKEGISPKQAVRCL